MIMRIPILITNVALKKCFLTNKYKDRNVNIKINNKLFELSSGTKILRYFNFKNIDTKSSWKLKIAAITEFKISKWIVKCDKTKKRIDKGNIKKL